MSTISKNCPACGGKAVQTCRCFIGDSVCAEGHQWHYCGVHKRPVPGSGHGQELHGVTKEGKRAARCDCGLDASGNWVVTGSVTGSVTEDIYTIVNARIEDGTVTADDFNRLISEVLDKSAKERVQRRTRERKVTPNTRQDFGRVVPKLAGHDDPPSQGRGRRYASGRAPKERQNRTQAKRMAAKRERLNPQALDKAALEDWQRTSPAVTQFLLAHHGKILTEHAITKPVLAGVRQLAARMLRDGAFRAVFESKSGKPASDSWLYGVVQAADVVLGDVQSYDLPEAPCSICESVCHGGCSCACHHRRVAAFEERRSTLLDRVGQVRTVRTYS